ncbi:MAG: hypothetical protein MJ102_04835 [Clostridia bacterium]|nr:hypothetical protein [Clostridia bacterium]
MPDRTSERVSAAEHRQSTCVHTKKILDSCINKDCVENLRVYLTPESQTALNTATNVKARCCELLYAYIDVQPIPYNRGHHTVDVTFYYQILGDISTLGSRPTGLNGLAAFSKRVVLRGGMSEAKIFSSNNTAVFADPMSGCALPSAVVEVVDPMILSATVLEGANVSNPDPVLSDVPAPIMEYFGGTVAAQDEVKKLYVTLGQFSTIRLERDSQLRIFDCENSIPSKECCDDPGCAEAPCDLFSRIAFPTQAFFPDEPAGKANRSEN